MNGKLDWDAYTAQLVASKGATATDHQRLESLAHGRVLDAGWDRSSPSRLISPGSSSTPRS